MDSIVKNKCSVFISKFWTSLCSFLAINWRLFNTFYFYTNSKTKWQNNNIQNNFWVSINFEQKNWATLLLMVKYVYINAKNSSLSYTPLQLNCKYYFCIFDKNDIHFCSKLKAAEKLCKKIKNIIKTYCKNLYQTQDFQRYAYNKGVKLKNYALGNKV